jgi:hypothetical protein
VFHQAQPTVNVVMDSTTPILLALFVTTNVIPVQDHPLLVIHVLILQEKERLVYVKILTLIVVQMLHALLVLIHA